MKVYGILKFRNGEQVRVIAAARSWKHFAQLTGMTLGHVRNYGSITGNEIEIEAASKRPGELLWTPDRYAKKPVYLGVQRNQRRSR